MADGLTLLSDQGSTFSSEYDAMEELMDHGESSAGSPRSQEEEKEEREEQEWSAGSLRS